MRSPPWIGLAALARFDTDIHVITPHVHEREDEFSYVLEGEIGARIGDQELTAGAGRMC